MDKPTYINATDYHGNVSIIRINSDNSITVSCSNGTPCSLSMIGIKSVAEFKAHLKMSDSSNRNQAMALLNHYGTGKYEFMKPFNFES